MTLYLVKVFKKNKKSSDQTVTIINKGENGETGRDHCPNVTNTSLSIFFNSTRSLKFLFLPKNVKKNRMDTNGVVGAMVIDSDGLCLTCEYK